MGAPVVTRFASSTDWIAWRNGQLAMIVGVLNAAHEAGVVWNGYLPVDAIVALGDVLGWSRDDVRKIISAASDGDGTWGV
jgi:hypothetical protein